MQREKTSREKGREKIDISKCGFIAPNVSVCQLSVRKFPSKQLRFGWENMNI